MITSNLVIDPLEYHSWVAEECSRLRTMRQLLPFDLHKHAFKCLHQTENFKALTSYLRFELSQFKLMSLAN